MLHVRVAGPEERTLCLAIRRAVFVAGQGVPEALEIDGLDDAAVHVLARRGGRPVGTGRLRIVDGRARLERIAVREEERGRGAGRALVAALEAEARARGAGEAVLHAQVAVLPFYERLGYTAEGAEFLDAGIPHRCMRRRLAGGSPPRPAGRSADLG